MADSPNEQILRNRERTKQLLKDEVRQLLAKDHNVSSVAQSFRSRGVSFSTIMGMIREVQAEPKVQEKAEPVQAQLNGPVDLVAQRKLNEETAKSDQEIGKLPFHNDVFNDILLGKKTSVQARKDMITERQRKNPIEQAVVTRVAPTPEPAPAPTGVHTAHLIESPVRSPIHQGFTPGYPNPIESGHPASLTVAGRTISVTMIKRNPDLIVFDNVLTPEECQALIEYSRAKIRPSNVVDRDSGENVAHSARTSSGCTFRKGETDLLMTIENFVCSLIKWPYVNSEGFQVLNYQVGQEYKAHHDYFDPNSPSGKKIQESVAGNRNATFLIYLNDVEEGGGTDFPDLQTTVIPKTGRAVFFSFPDLSKAKATLHAGLPPIKGEKWVTVNWYRQGAYSS